MSTLKKGYNTENAIHLLTQQEIDKGIRIEKHKEIIDGMKSRIVDLVNGNGEGFYFHQTELGDGYDLLITNFNIQVGTLVETYDKLIFFLEKERETAKFIKAESDAKKARK